MPYEGGGFHQVRHGITSTRATSTLPSPTLSPTQMLSTTGPPTSEAYTHFRKCTFHTMPTDSIRSATASGSSRLVGWRNRQGEWKLRARVRLRMSDGSGCGILPRDTGSCQWSYICRRFQGGGVLTSAPTVTPAVTEGIDPVLMYPKVPPEAQSAPIMYAGISIPFAGY